MVAFMLIPVLVTSYICFAEGQSSCQAPSGANGNCVSLYDCPPLLALLNKPRQSPEDLQLLRASKCGYQNSIPKVCCVDNSCTTPQGEQGQCISIHKCQHVVELFQGPISQQILSYVQSLRCTGPEQQSVCCGPPPRTNPVPTPAPTPAPNPVPDPPSDPDSMCQLSAAPPAINSGCCGRDEFTGDRITGGNYTSIDEYPWLAIIEYFQGSNVRLSCGAVLISGKYVLTAGHCVRGAVLNGGSPRSVRLGEYNTKNQGPDCLQTAGGGNDCTDGAISLPIERIIVHPEYDHRNVASRHDIALIRLRNTAPYTAFVRPICLPAEDYTSIEEDKGLWVAGWGKTENSSSSPLKLHVNVPFVPFEQCQPIYSIPARNANLWRGQMCAGGELGRDSCKGDSGGPLMYNRSPHFELLGIVSFGPKMCGSDKVPGVYTKVFEYLPWIRSQIQP